MNLNLKMKKEIRLHWRIVEKEKEINKIAYKLYRLKKNNQDLLLICSLCLGHSVAFGTMFSQWMPRMFGCRGSVAFVDVESVTKCSFSHFKFFMKLCKLRAIEFVILNIELIEPWKQSHPKSLHISQSIASQTQRTQIAMRSHGKVEVDPFKFILR